MFLPIIKIALTIFLVANPIGNSPAIIALLRGFDFKEKQRILLRESFFAFLIAVFFLFFGEFFLDFLHIKTYTVSLCGGILLLLCAYELIFPDLKAEKMESSKTAPFIVPIATPLIAGPSSMTIIMIFSHQEASNWIVFAAIFLAYLVVTAVLVCAPYLVTIFKERGVHALEKLMGMLLTIMSIEMIVHGLLLYAKEH